MKTSLNSFVTPTVTPSLRLSVSLWCCRSLRHILSPLILPWFLRHTPFDAGVSLLLKRWQYTLAHSLLRWRQPLADYLRGLSGLWQASVWQASFLSGISLAGITSNRL